MPDHPRCTALVHTWHNDSVDSHQCVAQPFHNCQEKWLARWTQKHGKHGSGALLNSLVLDVWWSSGEQHLSSVCPVCSGDQRVGSSLTGTLHELEARRNEWETRYWLTSRRSLFLIDSIIMEEAVRALQQQVNALMSQNAALEAQLISQQNIAQGLTELLGSRLC